MGLLAILVALGLLIFLAYRGWSILLLAPAAALIAAGLSGQPLLAHWTQTFMVAAAEFFAQFFPLFLLGALFGKLMEDSGSVAAIATFMTRKLGKQRAILAVVLAGALVTYGGVSLFVAIFVLVPMGQAMFRVAGIPNRLLPAAVALGTSTFTMSALPGTPAIQNAIPMPFFGTTPFAAPGLGVIASAIMLGFGLWWLGRREAAVRRAGEGASLAPPASADSAAEDVLVRERATVAHGFDPAELGASRAYRKEPGPWIALLPLLVVMLVNLAMTMVVLPRLDLDYLAQPQWGGISLANVGGVWSVIIALATAIVVVTALNWRRLPALRDTFDSGLNASVLPIISVASLVGFGAVVAAMPAFETVRQWVLGIDGGPRVGLAGATNVLAALTGSASGGMTIALGALGETYMQLAAQQGISPQVLHRVAVIGAGTLDSLPHNGAVVTLLAVCGATHKESYTDLAMVAIVGAIIALVVVIVLATAFGSF